MTSKTPSQVSPEISPAAEGGGGPVGRWTRRVFAAGIAAQTGIVLTGGLVRLTGSGLGCPSWPECVPGSFTPVAHQAQSYHKYIEFSNRMLTFAVSAVVVACVVAALRHKPRRRPLVALAVAQLLGVPAQAVLGGVTVLTHLNPFPVAAHFLLSMVLVGLAVALYQRGLEGDGPVRGLVRPEVRWSAKVQVVVAAAVLAAGTVVTGSGPHAGDEHARRFGVDPRSATSFHTDLVFLYTGLAIGILVMLRILHAPVQARRRAWEVVGVVVLQAGIGYYQYFNGLPIAAVALHMLGACLVVITAVRLVYALRERPAVAPSGRPAVPAGDEVAGAGVPAKV